jgi:arabinogalactan oligomer/maltooligosaccharide transport system substrate-binding protein
MMEERLHAAAVASMYDANSGFHFVIPIITETVALFYNRTLLNEYGFEVATTFEELLDQVEEMNDHANNVFNLRMLTGDAYHMHFALTAHGFQLFGPNHNDPDQVNFDTPETIAGLEWVRSVHERVLPVPTADLGDSYAAFAEGEAAYFITGPWHIGDLSRDVEDFDWGVAKIPTINGVQPITFSGNRVVAGSGFTRYPELTRAVLAFLTSDEGFQIRYEVSGDIPTLIDGSVIKGLADNPYHMGILAQANYSHPMPIIPEMSHFWGVSGGMYSSVWDGILSAQEAAEHAELGYDSARALAEQ